VTARLLWRHVKYAILVGFIAAAALTPSPDPWNQTVFAAPIIGLYIISIGIAWLVAPRRQASPADRTRSRDLKLVFAATIIDQALRQRARSRCEYPRIWRGQG
jgi:hypothetical protein